VEYGNAVPLHKWFTDRPRWPGLPQHQWRLLESFFPEPRTPYFRRSRRGRKRIPDRVVFEAILWYVKTGGTWKTCSWDRGVGRRTILRRLKQWRRDGTLDRAWRAYLDFIDITNHDYWRRSIERRELRDRKAWLWKMGDRFFQRELAIQEKQRRSARSPAR
jgi:transposase